MGKKENIDKLKYEVGQEMGLYKPKMQKTTEKNIKKS